MSPPNASSQKTKRAKVSKPDSNPRPPVSEKGKGEEPVWFLTLQVRFTLRIFKRVHPATGFPREKMRSTIIVIIRSKAYPSDLARVIGFRKQPDYAKAALPRLKPRKQRLFEYKYPLSLLFTGRARHIIVVLAVWQHSHVLLSMRCVHTKRARQDRRVLSFRSGKCAPTNRVAFNTTASGNNDTIT